MSTTMNGTGTAASGYRAQPRVSPAPTAVRGEPIEILLVEDSPDDADLTMDALRDGRVRNRITHVEDGMQAMAFLRREGRYVDAPRPDLILLDLNLPRKSGREVLAEVKQDPDLRRIPVVIMTSSDDEKDILAAYNLYVNCYVTKPVDLDQFIGVVKSIEHFWFSIVKLPAA
ncbi:MAG TPA: response regulator [Gemmataceae bacterium]|jgi:chemotaxis family two-component system response regulator Rcp1|nr:response regulator [Gemmataceae bacterium]